MKQLITFINKKTKDKYSYLKLSTSTYDKYANTLSLVFLYPDEVGNVEELDREELLNLTKEFVDLDVKLELKFVKSFYDEEYLKRLINEFNKKEFPALSALIKTENLTLEEVEENKLNIQLHCLKNYITIEQMNRYKEKLERYLNNEFFYLFEVKVQEKEEALDASILEKNKQQVLNTIMEEVSTSTYLKVEVVEQILGSETSLTPFCVSSILEPQTKVSVAGTVKFLQEREFTKKQKVMDSEEEKFVEVQKTFYSFVLNSAGKDLSAVYFPNEQTKKQIKKLEEGYEVVITGDVEAFNEKLSLKVKHITKVKILEKPKETTVFKPVPKEYTYIFPEPFESVTQASLFDDATEPNEYLKNNTFVVFDLETTGLNHEDCQIVEIGAVKVEKGRIVEKFSTFVDPEVEIPLDATAIHGITDEMVMGAPKVHEALADFYKFCENSTIVAYNIDFDYKFINYYGRKEGFNFNHPQKDA